MTTVLVLTLGLTAIVMAGMAVGVIFGKKELKGSCGGVANDCACLKAGTPNACKDGSGPPRNKLPPGELLSLDRL